MLLTTLLAHAITRDEVLARAQAWGDDGPLYSQTAWYTDPTTGVCCYRSDCSGFVSAVWGLSPPGHTTYSFAGGAWDDGVSYEISPSELQPGDALNYPGDPNAGTGHIMLYVSGDFYSGWVEVYEEYSTGTPATYRWRSIDPGSYLAIRYTGIEDCTTEVCDGRDNDCDGQADEDLVCEIPEDPALSAWRYDGAASSDVDGDGLADLCARGGAGLYCELSTGSSFESITTLPDVGNAQGFDTISAYSTLRLVDATGDGLADVCGRSPSLGFFCWPSTGAGFGAPLPGPGMTDAAGWSDPSNYATLRMGDIDGDGRAELCGRGTA